jgi:hypothetical protein
LSHNGSIGRLYGQKGQQPWRYHLLTISVNGASTIWSCIMDNSRAVQRHTPIITLLSAFLDKNANNDIATTSEK